MKKNPVGAPKGHPSRSQLQLDSVMEQAQIESAVMRCCWDVPMRVADVVEHACRKTGAYPDKVRSVIRDLLRSRYMEHTITGIVTAKAVPPPMRRRSEPYSHPAMMEATR